MRRLMIIFIITALTAPLSLNAEGKKGLGMWVWSNSSFTTEEARKQLIQFCLKQHIKHLDVHMRMTRDGSKPALKDEEAFRDLIVLAGQHNITTAALRGNPKMFFVENHERTMEELKAIIAFSETLPRGTLFRGVKYDVEPYCTKEWKKGGPLIAPIMDDYLALLQKAQSVLKREAPHLWLTADIPFWWDKERFAVEFDGKRKRFNEHVQDLTDSITIMSYRRSYRKILDCVEDERKYAQRIKKIIFPSVETVELKQDPHVSFWGVPNEEFLRVVPELLEEAKRDPAMGGVMIHCYRSLFQRFNNETPDRPGQIAPD